MRSKTNPDRWAMQKARKVETKGALQAELTRLQQKLSAEKNRRDRDAWEAQQKVVPLMTKLMH